MKLFEKDNIFLNDDGRFEVVTNVDLYEYAIIVQNVTDLNTTLSEDDLKKYLNELYLLIYVSHKKEDYLMSFIEQNCPRDVYERVSKVLMSIDSEKRKYMGEL